MNVNEWRDGPVAWHDDQEHGQAEEDAATAAGEHAHEEALQAYREELLERLRILPGMGMDQSACTALADWITELREHRRAQQDRITALLTAVDYLRPPF